MHGYALQLLMHVMNSLIPLLQHLLHMADEVSLHLR